MKKIILSLLWLCSNDLLAQQYCVYNQTGEPFHLVVWKDSKIIFDNNIDNKTKQCFEVGNGILLQFKFTGGDNIDRWPDYTKEVKILSAYTELLITKNILKSHPFTMGVILKPVIIRA